MPKEIDDVEEIFQAFLRDGAMKRPDPDEAQASELAGRIKALREGSPADRVRAMRLADTLKTTVIRMVYGKRDPLHVPQKYIKHAVEHSCAPDAVYDNPEVLRSIDGPTRAARVFCLKCQGYDQAGVRMCAAISCPLWPFRMGVNPFYGRLSDAEAEVEETDAEVEALDAQVSNEPIGAKV